MKKLLTILGSIALITSTSGIVVACTNSSTLNRYSTSILDEEIYNKILIQLDGDPSFAINQGSIFDSISDKKDQVLSLINDKISKLYYAQTQKILSNSLNINNLSDDNNDEVYSDAVNAISDTIASNQLYTSYTSSLISGSTSDAMDHTIFKKNLGGLNPTNLVKDDYQIKYSVWFSTNANKDVFSKWSIIEENHGNETKDQLPTIDQLENSDFYVVANASDSWTPNSGKVFDSESDATKIDGSYFEEKMTGQTALQYRLQEEFKSSIKTSVNANVLTMMHLDSQMWKTSGSKNPGLLFNQNSAVSKKVQTWDKTNGYKSNLKMVWSFTVSDDTTMKGVWTKIQRYLKPDGSLLDSNIDSIKDIISEMTGVKPNETKAGTDPYLGLAGFNGFVVNDGTSIKSVEGDLIASSDAYTKINQANGPSVISQDNQGKGYTSSENNKKDIYIVLPIYLVDLLNDKNGSFNKGQSTSFTTDRTSIVSSEMEKSKFEDIKSSLNKIEDLKINLNGVLYTLAEAQSRFSGWTGIKLSTNTEKFIDADGDGDGKIEDGILVGAPANFEGFVGSVANTHDDTYGNISLDKDVNIGPISQDVQGVEGKITVTKNDDGDTIVHVNSATDETYKVGAVVDAGGIKLSLDEGQSTSLYSVGGTEKNNNKTVSYNVNMGASMNNPNSFVTSNDFDYYNLNIASNDIANLSGDSKTSLLREIQYITSKDDAVIESAKIAIYPQFISSDDVLYTDLYNSISSYLKDDILNNGTSD